MAKIPSFPSMDVIAGYKGVIDFYSWKGIKIVRKWPVITGHHSTPREAGNQAQFTYFQKSVRSFKRHTRHLWRSSARLANWRYHELAYRWYKGGHLGSLYTKGDSHYPVLKPWPDAQGRFWLVHVAHWLWKNDRLWLVFWIDQPHVTMTLITSPRAPLTEIVTRAERGVYKECGVQPYKWIAERYTTMDSGFWAESPVVTHHIPWPSDPFQGDEDLFAQLVGERGPEFPGAGGFRTFYDYSTGPVFRLRTPDLYGAANDNTFYVKPLETAYPYDYRNVRQMFRPYNQQWRSWRWPVVRLPDRSDIVLHTPWPLEDFPPSGRLPV